MSLQRSVACFHSVTAIPAPSWAFSPTRGGIHGGEFTGSAASSSSVLTSPWPDRCRQRFNWHDRQAVENRSTRKSTPWGIVGKCCSRSNRTDQRAGRYRKSGSSKAIEIGWNTKDLSGLKPVAVHRHRSAGSARTRRGFRLGAQALGGPLSPIEPSGLNDIASAGNTAQLRG